MVPSAAEASCLAARGDEESHSWLTWLRHARLSRIGEPAEPESACSPGTSQTIELEHSRAYWLRASIETRHVGKSQDVLVGAWRPEIKRRQLESYFNPWQRENRLLFYLLWQAFHVNHLRHTTLMSFEGCLFWALEASFGLTISPRDSDLFSPRVWLQGPLLLGIIFFDIPHSVHVRGGFSPPTSHDDDNSVVVVLVMSTMDGWMDGWMDVKITRPHFPSTLPLWWLKTLCPRRERRI